MPDKSLQWIFTRVAIILTISMLVVSACQPGPGIPRATSEPVEIEIPSTPTDVIQDSGLQVVDDGSPLPPIIVAQQPANGVEFPVNGLISLTFDQPMNPDTTSSAWQLMDPSGSTIHGNISWEGSRTLLFKPDRELAKGALYKASLAADATSAEGITLRDAHNFQFTTMSDLEVSQVFPADRARGIATDAVITVIFNRPVAPLVIAEEQSKLPQPLQISPETPGKGEWVNTSVYAFKPDRELNGAATYTISVRAGLEDATGDTSLAQDYSWSFITAAPGIDSFSLSTGQLDPKSNSEGILPDVYFTIRFLQPMDQSSVEEALSLVSQTEQQTQFETKWNETSTTIIFTPTQQLALDTEYALGLRTIAQAESGGALTEGLHWQFKTIPKPAIRYTVPDENAGQGEFSRNYMIKFASPMRIDTVKERIIISPAPKEEIEWWYNEWDWSMSGYFLEPSTSYEIRFLAGMEDIYGNAIQTEKVVRFTTEKRRPFSSLAMPREVPIFRAYGPIESQQFFATWTNEESVRFSLASITPSQMVNFLSGEISAYRYRPDSQTILQEWTQKSGGRLNENVVKSFPLSGEPGDRLPPGFYFLGMDSPATVHNENAFGDYRLIVVASANLTLKSSATDGLIWLTDMETGEPIQGVNITIYDRLFQAIGSGITGSDGSLYLDLPEQEHTYDPIFAVADDGGDPADAQVFGFASSDWGSGVSMYDLGIWSDYYIQANQPSIYLYTERPLYRPGQPVYFKGILRLDNDLEYRLPEMERVSVQIKSYKDTVYDEELELSEFGSFAGKLLLDPEAALGYYTIEVRLPGNDGVAMETQVIGSLTFNVAEYRKPEFQVKVSAEPQDVLAGKDFSASLQADYYSGGGVAEAKVKWTLTSEPFSFQPPDEYSSYSFQDYEEDIFRYEEDLGGSRLIAEGEGLTDASGQFSQTLLADLSAVKTSRQLAFEATVTDLSESAVSGRVAIMAHQSQVYPGVKPQVYIGREGTEQAFDIIALDWDGNPLAGQEVSVEIVERRWYSVQEQDASGRVTWTSSVEEIPIQSSPDLITDSKGKTSVSFVPSNGGIFRAKVTTLDSSGNTSRASATMWVAGKDYIPWQQTNNRSFDLVTDQKKYLPGDTAQVLIASPFQGEAYALVTVERGKIRYQEVIQLTSNSTIYELPITADLAPNAYVSVLIIKGVDENNPRPNFKMGVREIQVDASQKMLQVQLIPDRALVGPGEQVGFTVRTLDHLGQPISAEVSLGLSDLATLSLLPPNSEPILDFFYSKRSLGVRTSVPISLNVDDFNAEIEENLPSGDFQGSGGGKGEDNLGVVEVRQDFPDTAFWDAHVITGSNGEANVSLTLPDNLTTWRMDARAATENTLVGQTTIDIVSTKPLLVRPQTPRFFVIGDQARIGAAVHNNTDQTLTIQVNLQAEGLTIQSPTSQTVEIDARKQAYLTWQAEVDMDTQRVDLIFSAEGGGFQDASRPPQGTLENQGIPVYRYEASETIGTSGQLTSEGTLIESIFLPQSMSASSGKLSIQVSPSLAAGMTDSLAFLDHFPYECVEQTVSRFLPNVISTRALKAAGINDSALEKTLADQVSVAMQRLYNWQNPDGGWGWWTNEKSDSLTSAYVLLGMIEAKDASYPVDSAVIERAANFLRTQITSIQGLTDPTMVNRQAFLLYVLARNGSPDVSSAVQLYEHRLRMALYARAFLMQTLYIIDTDDPRLAALLSDFASAAILSSTGSHWEEETTDRFNWNTDTRTTAIILSALSQIDPNSPLNVNAVRWLMSSRTGGHWRGTQETAWTLMALTNWMVASGELNANYQYAIGLNGERLGGGIATSENLRESLEMQIDITQLLRDQANRLAFTRDAGPGNLYYTAHLQVNLPVDQVEPLERGIVVSRSYYSLEDINAPITQAKLGDLLLARVTIVAPNALHYLVVDDPLPAGLEAVDQSLSTSPQSVEVPQQYSWNDLFWRGWGWWYFSHIQRRDEKVMLSASYLPAGTYIYTYLVRAGTAGVFKVIPTTAQEFYFPEVYGRAAGSVFTVSP